MIAYMDTSFLLKNYLSEAGSAEARQMWSDADGVFVSRVAYAEAMCAFHRKHRDGDLSARRLRSVCDAFRRDWQGLHRVEIGAALEPVLDRLVGRHALRGLDAVHLASALLASETTEEFLFASADRRLRQAARAEGMHVFPEV